MFDTSILEVTIGLVFIFSLLSIMVTQINSFISNILNLRARHLKDALSRLIKDPQLRAKMLAHPLVNLVIPTLEPAAPVAPQTAKAVTQATSETSNYQLTDVTYVAPATFVEAFIGTLLMQADEDLYMPLQIAADALPSSEYKTTLRGQIYDLETKFSHAKLDAIRQTINAAPEDIKPGLLSALAQTDEAYQRICYESEDLVPLLAGVRRISDDAFRQAIEAILITADTLDDARKKLENWFDGGMKRASDTFKNNMSWISFGVAFFVALLLNIDTFHIGRVLWEDPDLRLQVANIARTYEPPADVIAPETPDETIEPEATPEPILIPEEEPTTEEILQETADDVEAITMTLEDLLSLNLPIGWEFSPVTEEQVAASAALGQSSPYSNPRNIWVFLPGNSPSWFSALIIKFIGILATAIAGAQGAPFWFDLLNKIAKR